MYLLVRILDVYMVVLFIRVILSWVSVNPYNPMVQVLDRLTEPVLAPIRRVIPSFGGLDLSPLVVFVGIMVLKRILLGM
ncbi:MAG: YggT family protein [Candidatus Latescibacteria bacterium]|jgi:YggT family protein|nr:YggT family protein [Candidatus Latescibacterota bacterium]